MAQYKIAVDAGHGGSDNGAVFGNRKEKDDNFKLANAIGKILENNGMDVYYVRTDDEYETPFKKATDANNSGANFFVSIHRNSSEIPDQYNGIETLVYNDTGVKAKMARNINAELEKVGYKNLGVDERPNLVVLKRTKMPAVLVEAGFINSKKDNELFDTKFNETAKAIANGVLNTINSQTTSGMVSQQRDDNNLDMNEPEDNRPSIDIRDYRPDMDMRNDMPDMDMRNDMPDMDMRNDMPDMDMRNGMPDMDMRNNRPDMDMRNGMPDMDMRNNRPDMDMRNNRPDMDMRNGMPDMDMRNNRPDMDMRNDRPDMDMRNDMPDMDMRNDMPDMDMRNNRPDMDRRNNKPWKYDENNDGDRGEKLYRVQVGAYRNKESADRMLNALLIEGFPAFIVYDDGIYKVQVGAFRFLANAIKMEDRLRRFRYNTYITV